MNHSEGTRLNWGFVGLIAFLVITALGGGVWNQEGVFMNQWQHQFFQDLCHQQPARSIWLNGQPMAVCARCFGIYSGMLAAAVGGMIYPTLKKITAPFANPLLISTLFLNIIDVMGNFFGLFANTMSTRLPLGLLLGCAIVAVLAPLFNKTNQLQFTNT